MKVFYTTEAAKFVEELSLQDHTRLERTRKLFEVYCFKIGSKYIKKITKSNVWELRAGKIRLFLCIKGENAIAVHAIYKKSQKLHLVDVRLAEKRCKSI